MDSTKYYSGIGSRETPLEFKKTFNDIAKKLQNINYVLRSGGADGADSFFEEGITKKEIYLPWKDFNKNDSRLFELPDKAFEIAAQFHPRWDKLTDAIRKLMARNVMQVLGKNFTTPSNFIICWTKEGEEVGGTAQAIRIAKSRNIPIFNFGNGLTTQQFWDIVNFIL